MMKTLLTIAAILICSLSYGQGIWTKSTANVKQNRLMADSVLIVPRDTGATNNALYQGNPQGDSGRIAWMHGRLWIHDGEAWDTLAAGADLSDYMKYSDSAAMLLPYFRSADTTGKWKPLAWFPDVSEVTGLQDSLSERYTKDQSDTRYLQGARISLDTLILKRKEDSILLDTRLPVVNPVWFGAIADDGVSDRNSIQSAINYAAGRGIVVSGPGQWDIDSTILVPGGTTWKLHDGAKMFLMDGSDCAIVSNLNKTTPSSMTVVDSMITISGGQWFGNGDNQVKFMTDGTPVVGFLFSGVRNLSFSPKYIYNTQTYAVFCSNVSHSQFHNINIDQGVYNPPLHNQDGLHFNGPADHISITNCILKTFDDAIAFNTQDVPQGPWLTEGDITDILISDIILNETRKGIRLLSATSLMDRVIVNNITGTATDNLLEVSAYGLGDGNFGDITISNVNVKMQNNIANNEYISFNNKVRSAYIDNVIRMPDNSVRATVTVKADAEIGLLQIDNAKTIADTTYNYSDIVTQSGAVIDRMVVNNYRYVGGKPGKSTAIAINGTTLKTLEVNNSSFDSLLTAVSFSLSVANQIRMNNNSGGKVYNSLRLSSSAVYDTIHLYGSVLVDTANYAFSTAGTANVGRIKSYLPSVSVPGSTAIFAPIRYAYSGSSYTLNPVSSLDLQTITNNSGATTNMMKVTGVSNIKNGNGVETFVSAGVGTVWSFDRGGTNTLQPLLLGGSPIMINTRALIGVSTAATDDGSTTLQVKGSSGHPFIATSGNLTLTSAHHVVRVTNNAHVVTLPAANTCSGRVYILVNYNTGGNVTVSSVNRNGSATTLLPDNAKWTVQSDGTSWFVVQD